ncbi:MAG: NAD-glutamate dehydrogenase [Legionellaceae bacterium]|nr:NAD-glutamate dehydrogenase [Legionellaceae bacterium]
MSYKFEEGKDQIINAVVSLVEKKMADDQKEKCVAFVRQFYETVALEDLQTWDVDDLYGAAVNFWALVETRKPHESKIHIYNPDYERHGWQTTHTVIEIVLEDMPFLVDTIRMLINRMGFSTHLIIHMGAFHLERHKNGTIKNVLDRFHKPTSKSSTEALILIEMDRQTDAEVLQQLHDNIARVLEDNKAVVEDWGIMREKVKEAIDELDRVKGFIDTDEISETKAFLKWMEDHHFTFLGMRDYKLQKHKDETILEAIPETGYGVLRSNLSVSRARSVSAMNPEAREQTLETGRPLVMFKTSTLASVHRDAYTDGISIKRYDTTGDVVGERRIIGLYTSAAYNTNPRHIPFLRHKVNCVLQKSQMSTIGHSGKVLLNIIETLPRDDLIQASEDELLEIAMGIYYMQERRRIRMFARTDIYRRFVSCLVYVPRERFNTELRLAMQKVLMDEMQGLSSTFATHFSESVLARIHFIVRIDPAADTEWDFKSIESKLIEVGRSWTDDLQLYLKETMGEEQANVLFNRYKNAFPSSYSEYHNPRTAVYDVKHLNELSSENPMGLNFYRPVDDGTDYFRLKVYQHDQIIPLSDVLPIVERMGMRAISERPYLIRFEDGSNSWINEFTLQYTRPHPIDVDEIGTTFQQAFLNIWFGHAESDGFNQLVLAAGLSWRQVSILRGYAKYFKQIAFTFSQEYIENALVNHSDITRKIVELFEIRFSPDYSGNREEEQNKYVAEILADLDTVSNLDEDKIIRQYVQTITSTLRTNYYQTSSEGQYRPYLSLKLFSRTIAGMPKPYPTYEIFVYSPRFEGVHLRGGKVARGGLRWSDRPEDFRTEILGLMKAQQVKNAVIVPSGAKGGFVPKQIPHHASREVIQAEGVACYQLFIRGLLDITDNLQEGAVVKPDAVICYDEDDPYLVVAADKGTATFSDIANEISQEHQFWLGDAFASGGSVGYDHKKMGITAKGAWESVKRHFYEMGRNPQTEEFTVVGIGDMSGDVFGNGMLLSKKIRLLAAFNHLHIFVDPDPCAETSYAERERLFKLPRSNWSDYDKNLISKGGGIFSRASKSITVTREMRKVFGIKQTVVEPNELIRLLLRSHVDLLWSGGIGTYVKAQSESNSDVGDRTNDGCRINAGQLRCKVVGEGGNLGFTQLARMEFSLNGGYIFTDFIDNSAGVNCSDKEVNIKILLDSIVANGDLTVKQRNVLLSEMTAEVSQLVLADNYAQARAISLTAAQGLNTLEMQMRYIKELERSGKLDRELEFLPEDKVLMERKLTGKGLSRPGISVLMCYSKTLLKEQILATNVPEDGFLKSVLISYFPKPLQQQFSDQMQHHPLKREIIATRISNIIVNEMGFAFVYRLQDETGAPVSAIVRAYMIARTILDIENIWKQIEGLGVSIPIETQLQTMLLYVRLTRRVTRWFLRTQRQALSISKAVEQYRDGILELKKCIPDILKESSRAIYEEHYDSYLNVGFSKNLAHEITVSRVMFSANDIIQVAQSLEMPVRKVAEVYFALGEFLELGWIRSQVIAHPTENHWESLSREALRDDLDWQQQQLTSGIIRFANGEQMLMTCFDRWSEENKMLIERWQKVLAELKSAATLNYTMFFVAIRELLDLTQTTIAQSKKHTEKQDKKLAATIS